MATMTPTLTVKRIPNACKESNKEISTNETGQIMDTRNNSQHNKIRLLYFFYRFSTGSLIPFIPLYMQHAGFDNEEIGRLQAIRPIVTMLSAPLWGGVADRTGRQKLVLISTFVTSAICRLALRWFKGDMQKFAIALCATSVFYAATSSLVDSIVVSSLTSEQRLYFGKLRLWGEMGIGVASSLMMHVSNNESLGFEYLFAVHGVSSCVAAVFMILCIPSNQCRQTNLTKPNKTGNVDRTEWKNGMLEVSKNTEILSIFGLVAMTGCCVALLENFCYMNIRTLYKTHGQMQHIGRDLSLYRVFFTAGGVLTWFHSGAWIKRLGPDGVILASVCCLPLCFFLYAGVGTGLGVWTKMGFAISEAIRSGIFAALWSSATIKMNDIAPPRMTSMVQSTMESAYRGVGYTAGAYFGGLLCKECGIEKAFTIVGKILVSLLCVLGGLFSPSFTSNLVK